MTQAWELAHRYARKAGACAFNKHSDRHQEHSQFCHDLREDIERLVADAQRDRRETMETP